MKFNDVVYRPLGDESKNGTSATNTTAANSTASTNTTAANSTNSNNTNSNNTNLTTGGNTTKANNTLTWPKEINKTGNWQKRFDDGINPNADPNKVYYD